MSKGIATPEFVEKILGDMREQLERRCALEGVRLALRRLELGFIPETVALDMIREAVGA